MNGASCADTLQRKEYNAPQHFSCRHPRFTNVLSNTLHLSPKGIGLDDEPSQSCSEPMFVAKHDKSPLPIRKQGFAAQKSGSGPFRSILLSGNAFLMLLEHPFSLDITKMVQAWRRGCRSRKKRMPLSWWTENQIREVMMI